MHTGRQNCGSPLVKMVEPPGETPGLTYCRRGYVNNRNSYGRKCIATVLGEDMVRGPEAELEAGEEKMVTRLKLLKLSWNLKPEQRTSSRICWRSMHNCTPLDLDRDLIWSYQNILTDEMFWRRRAHARFKQHIDLEKRMVTFGQSNQAMLSTRSVADTTLLLQDIMAWARGWINEVYIFCAWT